jgi:hypothetical protein
MIPSNDPNAQSASFQRSSMSFLTELFLQHENKAQPSMAEESEMSLTEFRDFQKVIADKGNVTNNSACIKMEMANFMASKRPKNAASHSAAVQPSRFAVKQKGAMGKLTMASSAFPTATKSTKPPPAQTLSKDREKNLSMQRSRSNSPIITTSNNDTKPRSKSLTFQQDNLCSPPPNHSKDDKKPRGKFLSGLADEKVAKADRFKHRKDRRAKLIRNKFAVMDTCDNTEASMGSSSSTLPPWQSSITLDSDDEGFIDGLSFFTGIDHDKMREKMMAEYRYSTTSTFPLDFSKPA